MNTSILNIYLFSENKTHGTLVLLKSPYAQYHFYDKPPDESEGKFMLKNISGIQTLDKKMVTCSKCGKSVDKMHAAPTFTTLCRECFVKDVPNIDL
jgi:hypothetical protein